MSAKSKRHMKKVLELPCVACEAMAEEAHHIRNGLDDDELGDLVGGGQKVSDWLTIPLCRRDHTDLHSNIKLWEMRYGRQIDHVTRTLEALYG